MISALTMSALKQEVSRRYKHNEQKLSELC